VWRGNGAQREYFANISEVMAVKLAIMMLVHKNEAQTQWLINHLARDFDTRFFLKCEFYGEKPRKESGSLKPCGAGY
jgi:hypothetical protein